MNPENKLQASWATSYSHDGYLIAPLNREHFSQIRIWRNEQINVLRQNKPLSEKDQTNYYENHVKNTYCNEKPEQMLFGLFKEAEFVAYGGLVHIDWEARRAELSFLNHVGYDVNLVAHRTVFDAFLCVIMNFAFEKINLNRLYTETYDLRPEHVNVLENKGFVREGRLRNHLMINDSLVDVLFHGITKAEYDGIKQ